jgi:hypothetical protein
MTITNAPGLERGTPLAPVLWGVARNLMNTTMTRNRYRNPWHDKLNVPKPSHYENDAPMVAEYRGVRIFKLFNRAYDFVLGDTCISQRAGITDHRKVIDDMFSGESCCCQAVADHLRAEGHNPMTYSEYMKKWNAGLVA